MPAGPSRTPRKIPLSARGRRDLGAVGPASPAAVAGESEVVVLAGPGQSRGPSCRVGARALGHLSLSRNPRDSCEARGVLGFSLRRLGRWRMKLTACRFSLNLHSFLP